MSAAEHDPDVHELRRRIVELEVKVSFHERTIDDLDAVLRRFTARVEALERELSQARGEAPGAAPTTADVLARLDADEDDA